MREAEHKKFNCKYCPNCRALLMDDGNGKFHCMECHTQLIQMNANVQEYLEMQDGKPESVENKEAPRRGLVCQICGEPIERGIYCRSCAFQEIGKLQESDEQRLRNKMMSENYGYLRYKGYRNKDHDK